MRVQFHRRFDKDYAKLSEKLKAQTKARIKLFVKDPTSGILHDHALSGKYKEYRSINITGDYRAIYKLHGQLAIFTHVGTHSQLYK